MLKKYQICFALFLKPKIFYNLQLIVIYLVADKYLFELIKQDLL